MESTLTLKFKGVEAAALAEIVKKGVFNTKSEAIRAALVHYFSELGIINRKKMWERIEKLPRRKASVKQILKDIKAVEREI